MVAHYSAHLAKIKFYQVLLVARDLPGVSLGSLLLECRIYFLSAGERCRNRPNGG
jgi:hypothetical protein